MAVPALDKDLRNDLENRNTENRDLILLKVVARAKPHFGRRAFVAFLNGEFLRNLGRIDYNRHTLPQISLKEERNAQGISSRGEKPG